MAATEVTDRTSAFGASDSAAAGAVARLAALVGSARRRPDIVLASSPPLLVAVSGAIAAARHRVPWVMDVRDLWPDAAEALLLSAELAAKAGDLQTAQAQLGEVILKFQTTEQAQVATLNRAILAIKAGRPADALPELSQLVQRAPSSPYIGRARIARGVALLASGQAASAQPEFQAGLAQGEDVLSHLGLGVGAFARAEWDAAAREFTAARDAGSGAAGASAEYGLAAHAYEITREAEDPQDRYDPRVHTDLRKVDSEIGLPIVSLVPEDTRAVQRALLAGQPAVCEPSSRIRAPLLDLMDRVAAGQVTWPQRNPWAAPSLWTRVRASMAASPLSLLGGSGR